VLQKIIRDAVAAELHKQFATSSFQPTSGGKSSNRHRQQQSVRNHDGKVPPIPPTIASSNNQRGGRPAEHFFSNLMPQSRNEQNQVDNMLYFSVIMILNCCFIKFIIFHFYQNQDNTDNTLRVETRKKSMREVPADSAYSNSQDLDALPYGNEQMELRNNRNMQLNHMRGTPTASSLPFHHSTASSLPFHHSTASSLPFHQSTASSLPFHHSTASSLLPFHHPFNTKNNNSADYQEYQQIPGIHFSNHRVNFSSMSHPSFSDPRTSGGGVEQQQHLQRQNPSAHQYQNQNNNFLHETQPSNQHFSQSNYQAQQYQQYQNVGHYNPHGTATDHHNNFPTVHSSSIQNHHNTYNNGYPSNHGNN